MSKQDLIKSKIKLTGQEKAASEKLEVEAAPEPKPTEKHGKRPLVLPERGADIPVMYSLPEVQEILGVTYKTAHTYLKEGKIKGVKVGGHWRVTEDNLKRFLNGE